MSFASDLLDGWDTLNQKTRGGVKSCTDQADILGKFAEMERNYGQSLIKFAQSKTKNLGKIPKFEKEVGSTLRYWETFYSQIEIVGQTHVGVAEKIDTEVKEIRVHVKNSEKEKKKLESESKKLMEDWKKTKDNLDRTRGKYVQLSKEAEAAESHHSNAKSDVNMKSSALTKLASKATNAAEKASKSDNEYKSALQTTNEKQKEYYTNTMPTLLNKYQTFEETRLNFLKGKLNKVAQINSEKPSTIEATCKKITETANLISVEEDIRAFITESNTGVSVPDDIPYANYDSEVPSNANVSKSTKTNSIKPSSQSTTGGWAKKNDILSTRAQWGLTPNDQNLPKEKKEEILRQQIEELDKGINSEKKGLEGLEILVRSYATDPVAQKKTEVQVRECEDALKKLEEVKVRLEGEILQLNGGQISNPTLNQGGYEQDDDILEGEPAVGLFDYTATCDTELSFKEGDPLNITQKDDSGWWYAQTPDGRVGFVPNNYVKLTN